MSVDTSYIDSIDLSGMSREDLEARYRESEKAGAKLSAELEKRDDEVFARLDEAERLLTEIYEDPESRLLLETHRRIGRMLYGDGCS